MKFAYVCLTIGAFTPAVNAQNPCNDATNGFKAYDAAAAAGTVQCTDATFQISTTAQCAATPCTVADDADPCCQMSCNNANGYEANTGSATAGKVGMCDADQFFDSAAFCTINACANDATDKALCCKAKMACNDASGYEDNTASATAGKIGMCDANQMLDATAKCTTNTCANDATDKALCCKAKMQCDNANGYEANTASATAGKVGMCDADQVFDSAAFCTTDTCANDATDKALCCKAKMACNDAAGYEENTASATAGKIGMCDANQMLDAAAKCTTHACANDATDKALCCKAKMACNDAAGYEDNTASATAGKIGMCDATQTLNAAGFCATGTCANDATDKASCCTNNPPCTGAATADPAVTISCTAPKVLTTVATNLCAAATCAADDATCCMDKMKCTAAAGASVTIDCGADKDLTTDDAAECASDMCQTSEPMCCVDKAAMSCDNAAGFEANKATKTAGKVAMCTAEQDFVAAGKCATHECKASDSATCCKAKGSSGGDTTTAAATTTANNTSGDADGAVSAGCATAAVIVGATLLA